MKALFKVSSLVLGGTLVINVLLMGGCTSQPDANKKEELCTLTTPQDGVNVVKANLLMFHNYGLEIQDGNKRTYYSDFKLECIKE